MRRRTAKAVGKALIGGTVIGGAIIAGAMALIERFEGTRLEPYRDIVGKWTVCKGETRVPMRHYSKTECDLVLRKAIAGTYGKGVLAAVPGIARHRGPLIASISLAYNIGVPAFRESSVARRFRAGDWRGGCEAFGRWVYAGGTVQPGLVRRRAAERALCLGAIG